MTSNQIDLYGTYDSVPIIIVLIIYCARKLSISDVCLVRYQFDTPTVFSSFQMDSLSEVAEKVKPNHVHHCWSAVCSVYDRRFGCEDDRGAGVGNSNFGKSYFKGY